MTLDGEPDDGYPGEGDNVRSAEVGVVSGGSAADKMYGDALANELRRLR